MQRIIIFISYLFLDNDLTKNIIGNTRNRTGAVSLQMKHSTIKLYPLDLGEIESPPLECHSRILPLNYRPKLIISLFFYYTISPNL